MWKSYQEISGLSTLLRKLGVQQGADFFFVNFVTVHEHSQDCPIHVTIDFHPRWYEILELQMTRSVFGTGVIDGTVLEPGDSIILLQPPKSTFRLGTG
jgi:hypothetical protein